MKKPFFAFLFPVVFLLFPAPVRGQAAAEIERLLGQREITCTQAAWYILGLALERPPANGAAAFAYAKERGWYSERAQSGDTVTMGSLSLLIMKAFGVKGGMMYQITGSQRYALREMKDRGIIDEQASLSLAVSGEQFLQIAGYVMNYFGEGR